MLFYRPVHTEPLAELVSYFFAAALVHAIRDYTSGVFYCWPDGNLKSSQIPGRME
jgi:hypothetical protein